MIAIIDANLIRNRALDEAADLIVKRRCDECYGEKCECFPAAADAIRSLKGKVK